MGQIFEELNRRNVFRVAAAYLVAAWLVLQVAEVVLDAIEAPPWVIQVFLLVLALGFPLALLLSWVYEFTPEGVKREKDIDRADSVAHRTGKKLDQVTIGMVGVLVIFIVADRAFFAGRDDPGSTRSPVADKSLAVLAFDDLSPEGDQEYFADGLSEELLNVLAQVPDIKVAGRTSSFAFKNRNTDLREIGEILNVAHILEGSVRKSGNRIRVTAQLVDAYDGFHLYSETFDRALTDVFAVQDEIAARIAAALQSEIIGTDSVHEADPTAIEAYDLYLVARQKLDTRNREEMEEASRLLDRALAIDPDYVPALAQKAFAAFALSDFTGAYGDTPVAEALAFARPLVDRAIRLDPRNAEAHAVSALLMRADPDLDVERRIAALELALSINPNLDNARNWLASAYLAAGRESEALALYESIVERDPVYGPAFNNLVQQYAFNDEFDKASALIGRVERITGETDQTNQATGTLAFVQGEIARAIPYFRKVYESNPSSTIVRLYYGLSLLRLGEYEPVVEVGTRWDRIRALTELGRYPEAESLLLQLQAVAPTDDTITVATEHYVARGMYQSISDYVDGQFGDLDSLLMHFDEATGLQSAFAPLLAIAYRQLGDEAAHGRVVDFLAQAVEKQRALSTEEDLGLMLDRANLAAVTGDADTAYRNLATIIEHRRADVDIFEGMLFAPLLEQERFVKLNAALVEHINGERAQLGLGPYRPNATAD